VTKLITSFRDAHRFLSNFYLAPVEFEREIYPSSEHAFQAAKTVDAEDRRIIREEKSPGKAKRLGQQITLRDGWEEMKVWVMEEIVKNKFENNADLRILLLRTGNAKLVEENTWGDKIWGVYDGEGENWLGKILMKVREELWDG